MSHVEHFDTLILGSGQGGKLLAWHLGRLGRRVGVVERQWVGGSCPAVACLPSKNEIWSARVAHLARHAGDFGTTTGPVAVDMLKVRERKRGMIEREAAFHVQAYASSGAELIMGSGRFIGPKTIEVQLNDGGTRTLVGDQVVVNVGTHAAIPDVPGLLAADPLTHIGALDLDYAPAHLVVLGGGYIGIEMAQAYRRFGSRVTIVERGARLMAREDVDISEEMLGILRNEGIDVVTSAETLRVEGRSGTQVRIVLRTASGERVIDASDILVAAGRVPNTAGIGLELAGIELDERGYIRVNDRLQASAPGVWAIGEVAGSPQFTHVSVDDFRIVRDNLAGGHRTTTDRLVPYTLFTDPPLARVGLNESDALRDGIAVRVATLPMSNVLRTEATDETQGFMKVLVGADDDRILGFTMIGPEAGEVMASVQTAMIAELPYQKLRDAVISHLTFAEGLGPLLSKVPARLAP
ncbi:putative pyridine nucleotide-disulfide oxidoreductase RclA [Paraburkholderia kirstenboschensis]|uniref:FAD-dependent oxidoreductase n=1 Tax=Paraburkholderia kirstenboschensis TaxID=1245436 RepID=UPI000A5EED0E|nr:FAD-dependent oxidoreductase [Paraburkholderia kirstenboschensis]CAD6545868.1 putative pyridine nucleotide-disulfide oxidoreductase RclA [Paraburkholderia kirstenboschensis]